MILEDYEEFENRTLKEKQLELWNFHLNYGTERYDTSREITTSSLELHKHGIFYDNQFKVPIGKVGAMWIENIDDIKLNIDNYPREIQGNLDLLYVNLKEWSYFPNNIHDNIYLENCNFKDLKFMNRLINFNGDIQIYECYNLTSLEGLPKINNNVLKLNNCSKLNTLYGIEEVLDIQIVNCKLISTAEEEFVYVNKESINKKYYWKNLYAFIEDRQLQNDSLSIPWPDEMFKTFTRDYKNLILSTKAVSKFNI